MATTATISKKVTATEAKGTLNLTAEEMRIVFDALVTAYKAQPQRCGDPMARKIDSIMGDVNIALLKLSGEI